MKRAIKSRKIKELKELFVGLEAKSTDAGFFIYENKKLVYFFPKKHLMELKKILERVVKYENHT